MRHLRLYNESQGLVLYREMSIVEWYRIVPRSVHSTEGTAQRIHLDIQGFSVPSRLVSIGCVTDPVSPFMVPEYIKLIRDAIGCREDTEYMQTVVSTLDPEYGNEKYKVSVNRHFLTKILGNVDIHYISIDNSNADNISVLFRFDNWVAVRFTGEVLEGDKYNEVMRSYMCDGITGVRQCLEMIKKWEKK
jgi:hypothetical protein